MKGSDNPIPSEDKTVPNRRVTFFRILHFLNSFGVILLEKIAFALTTPIMAQWSWVAVNGDGRATATRFNSSKSQHNTFEEADASYNGMSLPVMAVLLANPVVGMLLSPLTGILGDRFGHDLPILFGLGLNIIMSIIFAFYSSFEAVFIACILQGTAGAFNTPNAFAKINKLFPPQSKAGKLSLCLVMTANVFSFIGPAIEGLLHEYFGQMVCFLMLLVPLELVLCCGTISAVICNCKSANMNHSISDPEELRNTESNTSKCERQNDTSVAKLLLNPKVIIAAATFGVAWLPRKCVDSTIAMWMDEKFSSGPAIVGLAISLAAVVVPVANVFGTSFASMWPDRLHLLSSICVALCGLTISTMFLSPNPEIVSICYASYIFFACTARYGAMSLLSVLAEKFPNTPRGTVMSAASVGLSICNLIGPLIAIPLFNSFGFISICVSVGPLCCLFAPLVCVFLQQSHGV